MRYYNRVMNTIRCHDKDGNLRDIPIEKIQFRPSVRGVIIESGKILLSEQ
jgi:hypothetical protein